jgi:hypothetical protein
VACRQNFLIVPFMALRRTYVLDATVPMLNVVPMHESSGPSARCLQISETFGREPTPTATSKTSNAPNHRIGSNIREPSSEINQ